MTELEKIELARLYIEKLANGINPLDDSIIPEQEVINNVRISRCLFFVSDILRQEIVTGETATQENKVQKAEKLPFSLSPEQKNSYMLSAKPTTISNFTRQLNGLINSAEMSPLKYSSITKWLFSIGLLASSEPGSESKGKVPTAEGKQIGIWTEECVGQNGPYIGVFYNLNAQRFILDHLDTILEFEKCSTELQGKPWTTQQDQCLLDLYRKGVPIDEIVITLKRNRSSIRSRLRKLKNLK